MMLGHSSSSRYTPTLERRSARVTGGSSDDMRGSYGVARAAAEEPARHRYREAAQLSVTLAPLPCLALRCVGLRGGQGLAQELNQRRAVAVRDVETQPLHAALDGREQCTAREQDSPLACPPHQLVHVDRVRDASPQEHAFSRGSLEFETC